MTTKEMIKVMRAYENGKKIEYCDKKDPSHWCVSEGHLIWDWVQFDYRVKEAPKYRPYENEDEFFQAQKEHGMYLKYHNGAVYKLPLFVRKDSIEWVLEDGYGNFEGSTVSYTLLLKDYTWRDGTPCGIKKN